MQSRLYSKPGLYRLLSPLEAAAHDSVTVYITPDSFPDYVGELQLGPRYRTLAEEINEAVNAEAVISGARRYGTGAAIFWDGIYNKLVVLPPFPVVHNKLLVNKLDTSGLREILEKRRVIGVVLVTWGWYALGVFDGGNLVASKTGTGHIHKKHKKGGSSQKRFARRTEEQRSDFLRRVGNRIDERLMGFAPDQIFFGGNRLILKPLIEESKYLQARTGKILPRILDVRYADREALAGSLAEITKTQVFTF